MPFKRALAYSVVINLFFLTLCLIFGDLKFGAIDDYFMAARLTGAFGTDYNPHLIFVNAIYGYALLPLYHLFPKIGWYYTGEMFSVFLSLTVIGYVLLQKCGERWGAVLAALFTALFASDFYLVVQFTQCASILSAAGMLLFAYGVIEHKQDRDCRAPSGIRDDIKKAIPFALGVLLMLWGSVMRWQAFLMGMPFFCLGMLFILKKCWKVKWHIIAGLTMLFSGSFAMHHFDQEIYRAPEYKEFVEFQEPRVILGDYGNYDQNAVFEDAEEIGLSGKDFHMLKNWTWYDTETFSVDSLKQYADIATAYLDQKPLKQIPRKLLQALGKSLYSPLFWTWFILCLTVIITNSKKHLYPWTSLVFILAMIAYLLAMGRLVYRVESGFWLFAAVWTIPLFGKFPFTLSYKITCTILCIITIANIYTYASSGSLIRSPEGGDLRTLAIQDSTDYTQVFNFIDSQPNKIFLLSDNALRRFSHHRNHPYQASPIGSYRHTVSIGYWTPYLPEITKALADYGITNPMKDVIHDNVIVLDEANLADFLQRHYYDSVAVDTLRTIGEMTFYKYRLVSKETQ